MPQFSRHATVDWSGPLREGGKGTAAAGTGAFNLPVTFASRIAEPEGRTSPEELIAAAHATCYVMVVNGQITRAGGKAARTTVTCTITADLGDAGITIATSKLELTVEGLEGIDAHALPQLAKEWEGKCPVSNALRNNVAISVEVHVK